MRSTQKQQNEILDEIKGSVGLESRAEASRHLYGVIGKAFKRHGVSISHYLNGRVTITKDHISHTGISVSDLFTPQLTSSRL